MGQLSNVEVASRLGMSHSGVSRMRQGERIASIDVLERLVHEFNADPTQLLTVAAGASRGTVEPWVELLCQLFDDGIDDPEVLTAV